MRCALLNAMVASFSLVFYSFAKESSVAFGTCQKLNLMFCLHAYLAVYATSVKKNRNGAICILNTIRLIRLETNASGPGPSIQRYAKA